MGLFGGAGVLFGNRGKSNYSMPDLSFLRTPAATTQPDFLNDYGWKSDSSFDKYANAIGAPSSVDEVRGNVYDEGYKNTLDDIERTTRGRMGTDLMKSFSRGLYDPQSGADSDIARIGQAQVAAEGGRTAANAATTLAGQKLDLQKAKEQALWQALGQGYTGDLSTENQMRGLRAQIEQGNTAAENARRIALANAMNGQASDYARYYQNATPSAIEQGISHYLTS